ncbi:hypothetical protein [Acinetobacter sp. G11]|uniref:hypothetical protein n=1 Tax=Acinetobacter sp. G11 TaxID=3415989 RepID=UPI003C7C3939
MALKVAIQKSKDIAVWKEYKDADGNVLAEFKIRGDEYKPYLVASERAQNQIASKGYNVALAGGEDKLYHELLLEAAACHLIADWKGITFVENDKEVEVGYSPENATKLLNMGDIGPIIWMFVKDQANKIQIEANKEMVDTLGKLSNSTNTQSDMQDSPSTK